MDRRTDERDIESKDGGRKAEVPETVSTSRVQLRVRIATKLACSLWCKSRATVVETVLVLSRERVTARREVKLFLIKGS
jgi:hypothetical protein